MARASAGREPFHLQRAEEQCGAMAPQGSLAKHPYGSEPAFDRGRAAPTAGARLVAAGVQKQGRLSPGTAHSTTAGLAPVRPRPMKRHPVFFGFEPGTDPAEIGLCSREGETRRVPFKPHGLPGRVHKVRAALDCQCSRDLGRRTRPAAARAGRHGAPVGPSGITAAFAKFMLRAPFAG